MAEGFTGSAFGCEACFGTVGASFGFQRWQIRRFAVDSILNLAVVDIKVDDRLGFQELLKAWSTSLLLLFGRRHLLHLTNGSLPKRVLGSLSLIELDQDISIYIFRINQSWFVLLLSFCMDVCCQHWTRFDRFVNHAWFLLAAAWDGRFAISSDGGIGLGVFLFEFVRLEDIKHFECFHLW